MNYEDDFMTVTSEAFSKMRLVLEGAVALFEDEVCPIYRLLRDSGEPSAVRAFDDIGTALYTLRQDVRLLQEAYQKASHSQKPIELQ